ncbi:hypothetical protein D9M68_575490 [compost metagenome]
MAKIKDGILGPFSGKVGTVIGGMWKTVAYIRAVPKTKTKRRRTARQIATQEKMRFINNFLVPFHPYITVGLVNEAANKTEISAAFSLNYHTTFSGTDPNISIDYSKFIFIKGTLPMVTDMVVTLVDGVVQITWKSENGKVAHFNDQMMVVLYSNQLNEADGFTGGVNRSAKKCSIPLKQRFIGKEIHVYISITSIDRKRIANNVYLGKLG